MPDFSNSRIQFKTAKNDREKAAQATFLAEEKLKKLQEGKKKLSRLGTDTAAYKALLVEERELKGVIQQGKKNLHTKLGIENKRFVEFQKFTDPRKNISALSDGFPFLLFPVRLETRFKKVEGSNGTQHQLWVRIFPDECSIDTFESVLTRSEVNKTKDYWLSLWKTGKSGRQALQSFITTSKKAAWRNLAGNFQSGRAYWMTLNYRPINETELPLRKKETDVFLCIGVEKLPSSEEQEALKTFWAASWLAGNGELKQQAAIDDLVSAVGKEKAESLRSQFRPYNFDEVKVPSENPPEVSVHFVVFRAKEDLDTRQSSWSQAAKITVLPEKFVLLGYKGTDGNGNPKKVINQLGNPIPDPLVMGPDPSADVEALLKAELLASYQTLGTDTERKKVLGSYFDQFKESEKEDTDEEEFITDFLRLPPEGIALAMERVFERMRDEVKAGLYINYLSQRSETQWLFDFEEAVAKGMGFKVDLEKEVFDNGFDRLFVLGVKLGDDQIEGKERLEALLKHHQFGANGFSILKQGTPTNNTETDGAGYSETEDPDSSYERYFSEGAVDETSDLLQKKDGQWLSDLLGIEAEEAALQLAENYGHTDQSEAYAMNTALWNATAGYFMESLMTPVFTEQQEKLARSFFTRYVRARGQVPAIRIGDMPYGILPVSNTKNAQWLFGEGDDNTLAGSKFGNTAKDLQALYDLIHKVHEDFIPLLADVAHLGVEGDPHQVLLNVLGLHAGSVEFHQRYAESFAQVFNQLNLSGLGRLISALIEAGYKKRGVDLLKKLGYTPSEKDDPVPILEKFFLTKANELKGHLIDDLPLSESRPIRPYTESDPANPEGQNYVYWLVENARKDFDVIKRAQGFKDKSPGALLYLMLRHALMIEFSNTAFGLYKDADIMDAQMVKKTKVDPDFIGIRVGENGFESKFEFLEHQDPRISDAGLSVVRHIVEQLGLGNGLGDFDEILAALDHLKDVPTARLERVFVEHLDSCSYRLDAWLLGFVNLQLALMRSPDPNTESAKKGLLIGAYGWVEDLKPNGGKLQNTDIPSNLTDVFNPSGDLNILKDSNNGGYIHAPSVNQAITASVLRNAYISGEDPAIFEVNLSSERVRMAMAMIDGIRQGQSLGALLGYQLERGLHDRYEKAEVDVFIYELRKHFSLSGNQMTETAENEEELESITQIEARNVVDGLKLIKHINETGNANYPFDKPMRFATDPAFEDHREIIDQEVERLQNINDAVADLALSESVHQIVQGNYDRAAATMDAYNKGGFPPIPDVVKTPRSGVSLTHRVGIHFESGLTVADPVAEKARVVAEPAVAKWLADLLPPMDRIACSLTFFIPTYTDDAPVGIPDTVTAAQLGLSPMDLLFMINSDQDKSLTALDEHVLKWVHDTHDPRPDVEIRINYANPVAGNITFFEIAPLLRNLRKAVLESRPLKPTDLMMSGESSRAQDLGCTVRIERLQNALTKFKKQL